MDFGKTNAPLLRFGAFELDLGTSELRKDGTPTKLAPQPSRVLALLAGRAGELVSREEIQRGIWCETTVDFEQGLNFAIKKIRAALGDHAGVARYVETLRGRGYRFIAPVERARSPASPLVGEQATAHIQSLAVLPLENLSGNEYEGLFANGITEELTTNLAKIAGVRVVSREIAQALNVDAVVRGSVMRSGPLVRITAQLIRTETATNLWAETYRRRLGDVLRLQRDIARAIANEVKVRLKAFV
jgi:TolB-like protein